MLKQLTVSNYILAEKWEVDFQDGFSVITGETGAGKSMLFGAISLILGSRSDVNFLFDKTKKCFIEAVFLQSNNDLAPLFASHELDFEASTVIRREIGTDGKSRAFVNDTPVSINVLRQIAEHLVDIHSQHDTQLLNQPAFQLEVVDTLAGTLDLCKSFSNLFAQHQHKQRQFIEKRQQEQDGLKELDYLNFQLTEMQSIDLKSINQEQVEAKLEMLQNVETIQMAISKADLLLQEGEPNLIQLIAELKLSVQPVVKYESKLDEIYSRIQNLHIEAKDIANELNHLQSEFHNEPEERQKLSEQLDVLYHLQKKHHVKTVEELLVLSIEMDEKIQAYASLGNEIQVLEKELAELDLQLVQLAEKLSVEREAHFSAIEKQIVEVLVELGMPESKFSIKKTVLERGQWNTTGKDKLVYTFAANRGGDLQELQKVASGGELSRFMLAIKSALVEFKALPCILFDEIDTGIGGEVAIKMGKILALMSRKVQVISITHLPQMAAKGGAHYFVYKETIGSITQSKIRKLDAPERIQEIAKMLSGAHPTPAAVKNAEDLIKKL